MRYYNTFPAWTTSLLVAVLCLLWLPGQTTSFQARCLDNRAPFKASEPLELCGKYADFGCCTAAEANVLAGKYAGIVDDLPDGCSAGDLEDTLCQRCSPYSAHIVGEFDDNEGDGVKERSFPWMCQSECQDFYASCKDIVALLDTGDAALEAAAEDSEESFCDFIKKEDCLLDWESNATLLAATQPDQTNKEPECLCLKEFATDLRNPTIFQVQPGDDDKIYIGEQVGVIYAYDMEGNRDPEPFLNISHKVLTSVTPEDERGLLGLAFHPDYPKNGRFYLFFSVTHEDQQKVRVSEFTSDGEDVEGTEKVVLEVAQPFRNQNGGQILFGKDGYLYVSMGDGGGNNDPLGLAQNRSVLLGKILRIDIDTDDADVPYKVPSDNPFVDVPGVREEIYAYGVRNMWRCSLDRGNSQTGQGEGRIFCGDVGGDAYEEVNIIKRGANYGWSVKEGPDCHRSLDCDQIYLENEEPPIFYYQHPDFVSIIGGPVYRGCLSPNLEGLYFHADFLSGKTARLKEDVNSRVWSSKELPICASDVCTGDLTSGHPGFILSFGEDSNGDVYIMSTSNPSSTAPAGKVYKLVDVSRREDPEKCHSAGGEKPTSGSAFADISRWLLCVKLISMNLSSN